MQIAPIAEFYLEFAKITRNSPIIKELLTELTSDKRCPEPACIEFIEVSKGDKRRPEPACTEFIEVSKGDKRRPEPVEG